MASDFNGVNGKANPKNGLFIEMNQRNQINGHSNGNVIPGKYFLRLTVTQTAAEIRVPLIQH